MANLTDPLIRSIQGSDPQNVMEYIIRQKIYDTRYWKEECFGLSVADVLEKAAHQLHCIGGSYGANTQPTKFLCLILKLLQLQPDMELIQQQFIQQHHFKYVKALGAFYLRLTGRPQQIYQSLEPLYQEYNKLRYRDVNQWQILHMDEFIDMLLTNNHACGIAMPRLPSRELLQQEGYLDQDNDEQEEVDEEQEDCENDDQPEGNDSHRRNGQRSISSELKQRMKLAGGIQEYLKAKVEQELEGTSNSQDGGMAVKLWEKYYGPVDRQTPQMTTAAEDDNHDNKSHPTSSKSKKKRKKEISSSSTHGLLFKKSKTTTTTTSKSTNVVEDTDRSKHNKKKLLPQEGSEEYWNEQRTKLGLKPLK
jgi:pre-mRNA-splicing factor 38A